MTTVVTTGISPRTTPRDDVVSDISKLMLVKVEVAIREDFAKVMTASDVGVAKPDNEAKRRLWCSSRRAGGG